MSGSIQLPAFARVVPYRSPDGQVEVDALAENDERWAVEIKWRGKATGEKELATLWQKAQALGAQAWFISRSGFTPAARVYADDHGILTSTRSDLESLEQHVRRNPSTQTGSTMTAA